MSETLCWSCKNTNGNVCPWFSKLALPVIGWTAVRRDIMVEKRRVRSYYVVDCPRYQRENIDRLTADSYTHLLSKEDKLKLGNALRKCMSKHNLTATSLAEALNKHADTVYKYLRGDVVYNVGLIAQTMPDIYKFIEAEG